MGDGERKNEREPLAAMPLVRTIDDSALLHPRKTQPLLSPPHVPITPEAAQRACAYTPSKCAYLGGRATLALLSLSMCQFPLSVRGCAGS